jgi:hypothetical protein
MSATRYWSEIAPKRVAEREKLVSGCGGRCFLMPRERKFPVCKRCSGDSCSCKAECSGLRAAIIRSAQWHYPEVNRRARQMFDEQGCEWRPSKSNKKRRSTAVRRSSKSKR